MWFWAVAMKKWQTHYHASILVISTAYCKCGFRSAFLVQEHHRKISVFHVNICEKFRIVFRNCVKNVFERWNWPENRFGQLINRPKVVDEAIFICAILFDEEARTGPRWFTRFNDFSSQHFINLPLHNSLHLWWQSVSSFPDEFRVTCIYTVSQKNKALKYCP